MATKTYDPGRVVVTIGGNIITGWSEGTFVTCERNENTFQSRKSALQWRLRARSRNKSGKITINLMQTSLSNNILAAIHAADESLGIGLVNVLVKDLNGTTLVKVESAWIEKPANVEFSNELTDREWVLSCGEISIFGGGVA